MSSSNRLVSVSQPGTRSDSSSHSRRFPNVCKKCGRSFKRVQSLQSHLLLHANGSLFECTFCQQRCTDNQALQEHMLIHPVDRPFSCGLCKRSFNFEAQVRDHMKSHSQFPKEQTERKKKKDKLNEECLLDKYECKTCGTFYKQLHNFKTHMTKHIAQKSFKCRACREEFKEFEEFEAHYSSVHSNICEICGRKFTKKLEFKNHMLAHKFPFFCQSCARQFASEALRRRHTPVCTASRPFCCGMCDRRFLTSPAVTSHMQTHTKNSGNNSGVAEENLPKLNKSEVTKLIPQRSDTCMSPLSEKEHSTTRTLTGKILDDHETISVVKYCGRKRKSVTVDANGTTAKDVKESHYGFAETIDLTEDDSDA